MGKGTVIMYGIPAYGHINSNLYLMHRLAEKGFRVIYYATDQFQDAIEKNGCEYRGYPLGQREIDLTDGSKLLKLYRLILTYTRDMLPGLTAQARWEEPCAVIFDSLALWGRAVGKLLGVPSFSFYSIVAIDRVCSKGFLAYTSGFSADFLKYIGEVPGAWACRRYLKREYGLPDLDLLHVLMNKGDRNLIGYSRRFQPGGDKLGADYLFLGPMAAYRQGGENGEELPLMGTVIYISLGTIFNRDERLMNEVIRQLGDTEYQVVMVWSGKEQEQQKFPSNFIVRPFVDQSRVLEKASLFISAGGMNSVHEAILQSVPCLMCPQQGEQLINARQITKLGFGTILKNPGRLREQAEQTMKLKAHWNETIRKELTAVHVEEAWKLFEG